MLKLIGGLPKGVSVVSQNV